MVAKPTSKTVDAALKSIEAAERPEDHPRSIARRKVKQWKSDAEQGKLHISNQDDTGAPSLRVDEVLKRSLPNHAKENNK